MELATKPDWFDAEARMQAWWDGGAIDRPAILVTAPRDGAPPPPADPRFAPTPASLPPEHVLSWFTDPEWVIPRLEYHIEATFWGGEAFPVLFPVSTSMVAILAAYLGCPYTLLGESQSGWADPVIDDWRTRPRFGFDPRNVWWACSRRLLELGAERAPGRYYVGLPDLNGPGEIVALLRGTERLLTDLVDAPDEAKDVLAEVDEAWLRYWEASIGAIHQHVGGYFHWMGLWSDRPSTDLQNDFSIMISPAMFEEFFLGSLERQTEWIERTIYHLDGPGAIRHLELLLDLPYLTGIQWVQGAGAAPTSKWLRLLRRIQARGKLLVLSCAPWEVQVLLAELEPEGLLVSTRCETESEARELLRRASGWAAHRKWVSG